MDNLTIIFFKTENSTIGFRIIWSLKKTKIVTHIVGLTFLSFSGIIHQSIALYMCTLKKKSCSLKASFKLQKCLHLNFETLECFTQQFSAN